MKINITGYTDNELIRRVFNTDKYYKLFYKKEDFIKKQ